MAHPRWRRPSASRRHRYLALLNASWRTDPLQSVRRLSPPWNREHAVLAAIRDLGLEWHVVFNKVRMASSGVTKADRPGAGARRSGRCAGGRHRHR